MLSNGFGKRRQPTGIVVLKAIRVTYVSTNIIPVSKIHQPQKISSKYTQIRVTEHKLFSTELTVCEDKIIQQNLLLESIEPLGSIPR